MQRAALCLFAALALSACTPEGGVGFSPSENVMPDAREGAALYARYCAACHGESAIGDGPLARTQTPPPRNLTLIKVRNGGEFPRAKVLSTLDGYTRVKSDNTAMPEFGELLSGDLVPVDVGDDQLTPVPRDLAAIMFYLETIQK